jgi:hypothetical protein
MHEIERIFYQKIQQSLKTTHPVTQRNLPPSMFKGKRRRKEEAKTLFPCISPHMQKLNLCYSPCFSAPSNTWEKRNNNRSKQRLI